MKKGFPIILACAALLLSCAKEMDSPVQPEQPAQGPGTYTLTVKAEKSDRLGTKALGFEGSTLKATWAAGEQVSVYKGEALLGTLSAQEDDPNTLYGIITGEIAKEDVLTLKFLSPDYASQDGTLAYIASHCDYAVASVTVEDVGDTNITTTQANFVNQQAVVKLTLNVSVKPLSITLPGQVIAITPESALNELYVAIPALSSQTVSLVAAANEKVYFKNVDAVTLEAGKYYTITATLEEYSGALLVHNESELNAAVQTNNAQILFANDISVGQNVQITNDRTVTINMGGYKLDRGLTAHGSDGQCIYVASGSTLNLSNGILTGGWGGDSGGLLNAGTANLTSVIITGNTGENRGGGICNRSEAMLTMTGGSIIGNTSKDIKVNDTDLVGGGGIFNYDGATVKLLGVTITGNEARFGGGGICNYGTLKMEGAITVTGNTVNEGITDNVYLKENKVITVTGNLAGSHIGITMQTPDTFTTDYKLHNDADPTTLFSSDLGPYLQLSASDTEVCLALQEEDSIYYVERSWDELNKCVKAEIKILKKDEYTLLDGNFEDIIIHSFVYYVVKTEADCELIEAVGGDKHHLILCDGARLDANFIKVENNNSLNIYGQSNDSGKLMVEVNKVTYGLYSGIGGGYQSNAGAIVIHGGDIHAEGHKGGAGIGGGPGGTSGPVTVYGGKVYAHGYSHEMYGAAGIGGGDAGNGGTITIYGGEIEAHGSPERGGAGIGSGPEGGSGTITIHGGNIKAYGGEKAAGIGGGWNGNGSQVTINGGDIYAQGSDGGAGIGSGYNSNAVSSAGSLKVTGGTVYAYGSQGGDYVHNEGGAGIGGGYDASGGNITISGGYVYARGGAFAAGIGSGCEALTSGGKQGGSLTVTGGHVEAYGGEDGAGIGGGEDADGGTVEINGGYVYAEGGHGGAGIGGGEEGDGANVTITVGEIFAKAGKTGDGYRAIGAGLGSTSQGSLALGNPLMMRPALGEGWAAPLLANQRVAGCRDNSGAWIKVCNHPEHTASNCPYCIH